MMLRYMVSSGGFAYGRKGTKKELISLKVFAAVAVMVAHRLEILRPGLQAAALGLDVECAPMVVQSCCTEIGRASRGGLRRVPSGEGQVEL